MSIKKQDKKKGTHQKKVRITSSLLFSLTYQNHITLHLDNNSSHEKPQTTPTPNTTPSSYPNARKGRPHKLLSEDATTEIIKSTFFGSLPIVN